MPNTAADAAAAGARAPAVPTLDIAVGVLVDGRGRLLIARRRAGTPGAGLWEFPGGKHEPGETIAACLARELAEEIGVCDCRGEPLIRFSHDRGERPVRLHVWRVTHWRGEPLGLEGQTLAWVERARLADHTLLPATDVILRALDLPARYAITPAISACAARDWWASLDTLLAEGSASLLRLRDHGLDDDAYAALACEVVARAHARGARVLLDRSPALCEAVGADGLHWPAARLVAAHRRPRLADGWLVAASAHGGNDLRAAQAAGADFAVLSPVKATASHPRATPLGWSGWQAARGDHALPVYALGGLGLADVPTARQFNAQGVAAIRGFWPPA